MSKIKEKFEDLIGDAIEIIESGTREEERGQDF